MSNPRDFIVNGGAADTPAKPAATVLLLRDGDTGLDVFMVRRTMSAAFASGMYVFPGGRVDEADGHGAVHELCDGLSDEEASGLLKISSGGLAYWVAAIRECFEEAGVLLARHNDTGDVIRFEDPDTIARFEEHRHKIHDGELSMVELCQRENLRLITDSIHYISHWVTPKGEPRRFDTRFFVANAPAAQTPLHDDKETIESLWVRPQDAFDRHAAGDLALMPPTIANLKFVAQHGRTSEVMEAAKKVGVPPRIQPKLRTNAEGKIVGLSFPGDEDYETLAD
jgi:8-oxo-dGTP pyrophosphatase MutT (NUDIX family)